MTPGEKPLDGWKAIADAIGRDERTARRWGDLGMPVYKAFGRVCAMKSEILDWANNRRHHVAYKPLRRAA